MQWIIQEKEKSQQKIAFASLTKWLIEWQSWRNSNSAPDVCNHWSPIAHFESPVQMQDL